MQGNTGAVPAKFAAQRLNPNPNIAEAAHGRRLRGNFVGPCRETKQENGSTER